MWDGYYTRLDRIAQDTYPFWTEPINQRWLVVLDDASTTASLIVDHSHLLDGITTSGSPYSAVSSRFNRLRTSHPVGDDAVSRTTSAVGLAGTYQISPGAPTSICSYRKTVGGCLSPPIPRPGKVGFGPYGESHQSACYRPPNLRSNSAECCLQHWSKFGVVSLAKLVHNQTGVYKPTKPFPAGAIRRRQKRGRWAAEWGRPVWKLKGLNHSRLA